MLKKMFAILIILILQFFLLTGCWDQAELEERALVAGIGFDLGPEKNYVQLTAQIIIPGAIIAGSGEGGGGPQEVVELVTATGATSFGAARNIVLETGKKGLYSHNKIVVIGEGLAKKGVDTILDFLLRDNEFRRKQWILVAKGDAQKILQGKIKLEKIPAYGVANLVQSSIYSSKAVAVNLHDFSGMVTSKTSCAIATGIEMVTENNKADDLEVGVLKNTAVFKRYQLKGWLDDVETRGLLWVQGKVVGGAINIVFPGEEDKFISIETIRANSQIKAEIRDGQPIIKVKVVQEGNIANQQFFNLNKARPSAIKKLELDLKEVIEAEILRTLKKAQELNTDIYGFGEAFYRRYPKEWEEMEEKWDEIFPTLAVEIEVEAFIRMFGLINSLKNPK